MRKFTARQTTRLFSLALFTLALGLVQAQANTDFTGTWKIDMAKSDFGPIPAPDSVTMKIAHQDPTLKANVASTGGPNGDMTYDTAYTTDGKECVNHMGENEIKSTLKWDGDDLAIESKGSFGGGEFTAKGRWNVSADGKTLTITQHYTSAMGEADVKEVFAKQ
jgi:hypothetical protein